MFPVPLTECEILEVERIMCMREGERDEAWEVLWIHEIRLLRATGKEVAAERRCCIHSEMCNPHLSPFYL